METMGGMQTATSINSENRQRDLEERSLHALVQRFTEKWTTKMDLNKRDAAEFGADLVMVVQAVHRDASRETHALLSRSLAAMPPPVFVTEKKS